MNISIIAAIAENRVIGKDNTLLWHISDDLKHFKNLTENHTVVMGRKTYFSLPFRPLKNRRNIVISSTLQKISGVETAQNIETALEMCKNESEFFIIGGESIYEQTVGIANKIYLTRIHKNFVGDTFFPKIDENKWKISSQSEIFYDKKSDLKYSFINYENI
jgi:dihydrofolate reductase